MNDELQADFDTDFVVTRDAYDSRLHVLLKYPEQGGLLGAQLIVERIALHWRVCEFNGGPGLLGYDRYPSEDAAVEAAKGLLRAGDATRRLQGSARTKSPKDLEFDDDDYESTEGDDE
jgi:hypothetical protein